jgi:hypothetical protein
MHSILHLNPVTSEFCPNSFLKNQRFPELPGKKNIISIRLVQKLAGKRKEG